jgi:hypothetical protein
VAAKKHLQPLLTPTPDRLTDEAGLGCHRSRRVRKDRIRGTSNHKITPHRELVNQLAGGNGIDPMLGH